MNASKPAPPAPLSPEALAEFLAEHGAWTEEDGFLRRKLKFRDFSEAFAFMTRVALAAEVAGHHPDWSNTWNRVTIRLKTHETGQLTERDTALARQIEGLIR